MTPFELKDMDKSEVKCPVCLSGLVPLNWFGFYNCTEESHQSTFKINFIRVLDKEVPMHIRIYPKDSKFELWLDYYSHDNKQPPIHAYIIKNNSAALIFKEPFWHAPFKDWTDADLKMMIMFS